MERRIVLIWSAGDQLSSRQGISSAGASPVVEPNTSRLRRLTLQNVKANSPKFVHVRMENLGQKPNLRRRHGILLRQEQFQLEYPT